MIPVMNIIAWSKFVPWAEQRQVEQNVCGDASQAVSTGRLDRAVPAHALAGHRISWHGRRYRVLPERGVSSYDSISIPLLKSKLIK
jgi:hypothetical protein